MTRTRATLLLVLAALAGAGCRSGSGDTKANEPPQDELWLSADQINKADMRVITVAEADVAQGIAAVGRVAFHDLHVTHVFSPVTGRVTRVLAQPGQRVKKGTPLLALASPDVGQAFADLVKAQADVAADQAEYQRQGRLVEAHAAPQRDYEVAEDNFRTARAEYQRAQRRAAMLRAGDVDRVRQEYTLKSFLEGEVIARSVNPGAEVQGQYLGGASTELFTIGDIGAVWVYADVADVDLPRVRVGAEAQIRVVAYPGRVFHGQVDWIADVVDPALRTARVRCAVANEDEALKPEMLANVVIALPSTRALVVPRDAVSRINESTYVFAADHVRPDGRQVFKRRMVRISDVPGDTVPVVEGLNAGDKLVVEGSLGKEKPNDEVWPTPGQLRSANITVAKVQEQELKPAIAVGARLSFNDLDVSHVFSPVSGRIVSVLAAPGQKVKRGAPLAMISSPDVGGFVADVAKAEAAFTAADHEYQRQQDLYGYAAPVRAGTLKDLEAARDNWRKAQAELDRAKQKVRLLDARNVDAGTQAYVLRSPIAGEVIARNATPGLEIQGQYALQGNVVELFTVGSTDKLWVLGDVPEMDRPKVEEGGEVAVTVGAYPDKVFRGTVDWVADVLDPVLHTAKVRCSVDNGEHLLRPDMYEAVKIALPPRRVLVLPRQALMRTGNETVVFVATGRTRPDGGVVFQRRKVIANESVAGDLLPVSSGLSVGESVAVDHAVLLLGMI